MESSISLALADQVALRRRLDIVANNVANANTAGFRAELQIVQVMPRKSERDRVAYPLDRGSFTDPRQGPVSVTGNPLDIAIEGEGFLAVMGEDGLSYTRDGRMTLGPGGELLGSSGLPLAGVGGAAIEVPAETRELVISSDGAVTADGAEIGQIAIFRPAASGEKRDADGRTLPGRAPEPWEGGRVQQGAVEQSNVQPLTELVDLMELHRGYQRVQEMLDGEDERIRKLVQVVVQT